MLLPTRFTTQPKCPARHNRSHPLARHLIYSAYNAAPDFRRPPVDYVRGSIGVLNGTTLKATVFGRWELGNFPDQILCQTYNGSSDYATHAVDLSPYKQINVSFWHWLDSNAATKYFTILGAAAAGTNGFYMVNDVPNNKYLASTYVGTTYSRYWFSTLVTPSPINVWRHFSLNFDMSAAQEFVSVYVDAAAATLTVHTQNQTAGSAFTSTLSLAFMADTGGVLPCPGRIMNYNIFNRNLTQTEITQLYREPWGLIRRNTLPLYVELPAAAGAVAHRFELTA